MYRTTALGRFGYGLLILLSILFHGPAAQAQSVNPMNTPVKFEALHTHLSAVLSSLEQQSGMHFSFDRVEMDGIAVDSIHWQAKPMQEALRELSHKTGLTYTLIGNSLAFRVDKKTVHATNESGLRGRVVDFETSEPLAGATVTLVGTDRSILSDEKGYYHFNKVTPGTYALTITYSGYQETRYPEVILEDGRIIGLDVRMQAGKVLGSVVISSGARHLHAVTHTTEKDLVNTIRTANSVLSGISSEQISKMADRNAAQVVQHTAGVTIKDDKFPIVRGMDPRYVAIYLNDNIAPSTELYSRSFALDLIPSRIIDRIIVSKSPTPDGFGDMSGGAIRIYTKDAKVVKHFDIELVGSDRVGTSFNPLLTYQGGKYDYLGFDDGTRKLPAGVPGYTDPHHATLTQQQYAQAFNPTLQYGYKTTLPDLQVTMNYYNSFKVGRRRINTLTALNYRYEAQRNDVQTQTGNTNSFLTSNSTQGDEDQNIENVQVNLLQNFSMHLSDSGELYFRNFILENADKDVIVRLTHDNTLPQTPPYHYTDAMRKDNILSFSQRFLYAGNLGGSHFLRHRQQELRWNLGYSYSRQDIPDQRIIRLQHFTSGAMDPEVYTMPAGTYTAAEGVGLPWTSYYRGQAGTTEVDNQPTYGTITRLWLQNSEGVYNGSVDYDFRLTQNWTFKAGTFQQWKEREVYRKQFLVNDGDMTNEAPYPAGYYNYADWSKVNFHEQDLSKLWSTSYLKDDGTALKVYDNTQNQDSYVATEQLNAGYLAVNATPLGGKLDLYGGLRAEYDRQKVAAAVLNPTAPQTVPILVDRPLLSWLPSLNIAYRPNNIWVLRAAYGRSVNRPEFREISPFANLDFITNEQIIGSPTLITAHLDNYDLRAEFYPHSNRQDETISVGGFYKTLYAPIERIRAETTQGQDFTDITYQNADKGKLYGVEADVRKNLGFLGGGKFLNNLYLIANGALIHSQVNVPDTIRLGSYASNGYKRPLQGQAPYIANAGLFYDNAATGTKVSLTYNVAGTRIYAAGKYEPVAAGGGIDSALSEYRGGILELPRHLLDVSIIQRVIKSFTVKLSVQNLLNQPVTFVEDNNFDYKYEAEHLKGQYYTGDNIFRKYYPNRYIRLTFTYSF